MMGSEQDIHNYLRQNPNVEGLVLQPYAMGGGQWVAPPIVRLTDDDVERIARRVAELLRERV